MTRKPLTAAKRVRIFDANEGRCHICKYKIQVGQAWEVEHVKPRWLGGDDDEDNMRPAHVECHKDKTADEAPVRAKGTRVRARHLGIKKHRSIRAWRKFNGTAVYASRER